MPTISIRGNEMPASPIRKLAPLADAAKQRGVHVFHLNIGQPDLPTPQAAIDAIRNIDRKVLEYSPSAGYRSYREKLVGYYAKFNINLTADDIIITSGGSEAVIFSFLSCLQSGKGNRKRLLRQHFQAFLLPRQQQITKKSLQRRALAVLFDTGAFRHRSFGIPPPSGHSPFRFC